MKTVRNIIYSLIVFVVCIPSCKNCNEPANNLPVADYRRDQSPFKSDSIVYEIINSVARTKQTFEKNLERNIFMCGKGNFKFIILSKDDSIRIRNTGLFTQNEIDDIFTQNFLRHSFIVNYTKLSNICYCYRQSKGTPLLDIRNDLPIYTDSAPGKSPCLYTIDYPLITRESNFAIVFISSTNGFESGDKITIYKKSAMDWELIKDIRYSEDILPKP